MTTTTTTAPLVEIARAYDDAGRLHAIIHEDATGALYAQRSARHKLEAVHPTLCPSRAVYYARLRNNFGWTIEASDA